MFSLINPCSRLHMMLVDRDRHCFVGFVTLNWRVILGFALGLGPYEQLVARRGQMQKY